jgi:hypothetical protein
MAVSNNVDLSYLDFDSEDLELTLTVPLGTVSATITGPEEGESVLVLAAGGQVTWDKNDLDLIGWTWGAEITVTFNLPGPSTQEYIFTVAGKPKMRVVSVVDGVEDEVLDSLIDNIDVTTFRTWVNDLDNVGSIRSLRFYFARNKIRK